MATPGFLFSTEPGRVIASIDLAKRLEARGVPHLDLPTIGDNLGLAQAILTETRTLTVSTGIANIYLRQPQAMARAATQIQELAPGRFILGLGGGHAPFNAPWGSSAGKPVTEMREYVAQVRTYMEPTQAPPIMLAALGPRMTALAGEQADGVLLAQGAFSHADDWLESLPADRTSGFLVGNIANCVVHADRATALDGVRRALRLYVGMPNYQRYFTSVGYGDEIEAVRKAIAQQDEAAVRAAISERFAADVAIFGTPGEVRDRVAAWRAVGFEHLTLNAVTPDSTAAPGGDWRAIEDVVDGLA